MEEIWRDIKDYEGLYQVSNLGRVRSLPKVVVFPDGRRSYKKIGKIRKSCSFSISLYPCITLRKNGKTKLFLLHRIIANEFIKNTENKKEVNHKNGIRNDNRIENLEWVSSSENIKHAYDVLKRKPNGKEVYQINLDGSIKNKFSSRTEAQRVTGIKHQNISLCVAGGVKTAGGYIWR